MYILRPFLVCPGGAKEELRMINVFSTPYRTGVPNLSLTMYPFSIPTDEHVPLKFLMTKYFIMIIHRYI